MWRFFPFFLFCICVLMGSMYIVQYRCCLHSVQDSNPKRRTNQPLCSFAFLLPRYKEPFIVGRTVKEGEQLLVGLQAALRDIATTQLEIERLAAADQIKVLSKSVALI